MIASAYQEFPGNQLALEYGDDGSEIRVITETTTFKKVKWLLIHWIYSDRNNTKKINEACGSRCIISQTAETPSRIEIQLK
jgi:hypothetical protein